MTYDTATASNGSATRADDDDEPTAIPVDAAPADGNLDGSLTKVDIGALGGRLTNADMAALSRERLETLLSILPREVAAILITNRPPMPAHVEYEAHKKLIASPASTRSTRQSPDRCPSRGSCSSAS